MAFIAWALIFGIYEIAERTLLANSSLSLLSILHIIRGTGTSFVLAILVAWYFIRLRSGEKSAEEIKSSPSYIREFHLKRAEEFTYRSLWLVKLRWLAIAGVTAAIFCARYALKILPAECLFPLIVIVFFMVLYNVIFFRYTGSEKFPEASAFAQIFLDLISLTLLLHFSGGVENPFFAFFVFHVIISGILLEKRESYFVAAAACVLFTFMVIFEHYDIIRHYQTGIFPAPGLSYIVGLLAAFITTTFFSAYFVTSIMANLRRRELELRESADLLIQAGKMAAVGQLAAGIAHEINNPLATVAASTELLMDLAKNETLEKMKEFEPFPRHLLRIDENVFRCKDIILSLLGFARKDDEEASSADVNAVIADSIRLLSGQAQKQHKSMLFAPGNIPPVRIHAKRLQQVFVNMAMNAIDSVTERTGVVSIKTFSENEWMNIEFADNGCGIPEENIPRIFDPFFTTKPAGKGTGLGLYLCHQIISAMNGRIDVSSTPGKGSTFIVRLPL